VRVRLDDDGLDAVRRARRASTPSQDRAVRLAAEIVVLLGVILRDLIRHLAGGYAPSPQRAGYRTRRSR
jgi:hypothetical protein